MQIIVIEKVSLEGLSADAYWHVGVNETIMLYLPQVIEKWIFINAFVHYLANTGWEHTLLSAVINS